MMKGKILISKYTLLQQGIYFKYKSKSILKYDIEYQEVSGRTIGHIFVVLIVVHRKKVPAIKSNVRSIQFLNESHDFHSLSRRYLNSQKKCIQKGSRIMSRTTDH